MTRRPACAALPAAEHAAYGQGYERMRRHAVEPGVVHDRHGLAVVAMRGVAAWPHAVTELPAPPAALCGDAPTEPLPAGEVLAEHTTLELECIDRMYLNVYVPMLQTGAGTSYFFRKVRGNPVPSSALMEPMTRRFVAAIGRFAEREGIDLVRFERFERKDDRTQAYLRRFTGTEGVLYIGKAQEKARVVHTERREDPVHGPYPWLVSSTAMVNDYYVARSWPPVKEELELVVNARTGEITSILGISGRIRMVDPDGTNLLLPGLEEARRRAAAWFAANRPAP